MLNAFSVVLAEEVPPEMPEPALGINFARDGMQVRLRVERNG